MVLLAGQAQRPEDGMHALAGGAIGEVLLELVRDRFSPALIEQLLELFLSSLAVDAISHWGVHSP